MTNGIFDKNKHAINVRYLGELYYSFKDVLRKNC